MKRPLKLFSVTFALLLAAVIFQNCSSGTRRAPSASELEEPVSTEPPTLTRTDFMTGLENPWDMAFTPDGAMFFTEKCRGLSVRRADGSVARLFGTAGSAVTAPDFFCEGQSGMHGVALDPGFVSNRTIYVFMPSNLTANPRTNRVVQLVVNAGYTTVSNRNDIVTDIAYKHTGNSWGGAGSHSGGRLRFGPDGYLYVTTGDNHNGPLPQDLTRLGGKVLRVARNGVGAPGNNAPAGADPRIYTYGHRNVQGISFHPRTGQAFIAEHGPNHSDEVTALTAGGNGGWDPVPDTGVTCADNYCGYISNKASGELTPMTDLTKFPSALRPVLSNNDSQGMGPCEFLRGSQWKAWSGRLAVGIMGGMRVEILQLNSSGALVDVTDAGLPAERIRSLVQAPDGSLYVATDSGNIWKVSPQ